MSTEMSELHEAPEEIFLQVDPEGSGPGEWDTLDGATWCQERINHNDVRYVRADRIKQLGAENKRLREALEGAWLDGYCFCGPEGYTDQQNAVQAALAIKEPR